MDVLRWTQGAGAKNGHNLKFYAEWKQLDYPGVKIAVSLSLID